MTQIHGDKGDMLPVTVIEAGPCTVTEVRSAERDGYTAVQLGFGTNKESRFKKPVLGQFQKRNLPPSRHLSKFRIDGSQSYEVGQRLTVELFAKGGSWTWRARRRDAGSGRGQAPWLRGRPRVRTVRPQAASRARSAPRPTRRASSRASVSPAAWAGRT